LTRPICDKCTVYHTVIYCASTTDDLSKKRRALTGKSVFIVKCDIKGERRAPMNECECDREPTKQYIWPVAKPVNEKDGTE
jgi:hypothetical protein